MTFHVVTVDADGVKSVKDMLLEAVRSSGAGFKRRADQCKTGRSSEKRRGTSTVRLRRPSTGLTGRPDSH